MIGFVEFGATQETESTFTRAVCEVASGHSTCRGFAMGTDLAQLFGKKLARQRLILIFVGTRLQELGVLCTRHVQIRLVFCCWILTVRLLPTTPTEQVVALRVTTANGAPTGNVGLIEVGLSQ